ncbi:MAG: HD domain-containing protein [Clostridia bacterium]|nr:HD domain-containing protein [Clostridia bacterium]
MREILNPNLIKLAESLPFPLYVVGGKVRDYLSGYVTDDTDICAPMDASVFADYAEKAGYVIARSFRNTGTLKLRRGEEDYEFSSFRTDTYVRGVHRPEESFFTQDIMLDARRRDFKCNAVYYDIKADSFADPLGGLEDIKNRVMDTVVSADKVFSEDGLRLLRLARMAAQTGFTPSRECMDGARKNAALIRDIAAERIWAELEKILQADSRHGIKYAQYYGLKILDDTRVLDEILPELTLGRGIEQRHDFHDHDVLEHSLRCVKYSDPEIRLAALLHDCAKPYCYVSFGNFHGHDKEGMRIAHEICLRLKVPSRLTSETVRLVGAHMFNVRGDARPAKVKRYVMENQDILDRIILLMQADFSACKDNLGPAPASIALTAFREQMIADGLPLSLRDLAVKGGDLAAAGFPPESIGDTLKSLLEDSAIQGFPNDRETLMERAVRIYLPRTGAQPKEDRQS